MEADLRAARLAQELHAIVLATFQDQSAPLFRAATLQPPMSLVETPGGVELPPNEAHQRGRRGVRADARRAAAAHRRALADGTEVWRFGPMVGQGS